MFRSWKDIIVVGAIVTMTLGAINFFALASDLESTNQSIKALTDALRYDKEEERLNLLEDQIWGYDQIALVRVLTPDEEAKLRRIKVKRKGLMEKLGIEE